MDVFLGQVTSQAMNYAIRSGITITTAYAFRQCSNLLKEAPRSQAREELMRLQMRLETKIRIISPAIDMIELLSARGNTTLESAVSLTKDIRYQIQRLGRNLSDAAEDERVLKTKANNAKSRNETEGQLKQIVEDIKHLLIRIEDAVPLINLAITTSGVNLSSKLSGTVSPSRLLQASTFLTAADSKFAAQTGSRVQVGPTYTLTLYMLFAGHARKLVDEESVRETTWKEVVHKAKVKLTRVPLDELYELPGGNSRAINGGIVADSIPGDAKTAEFAYQLLLIEDLDDDRVHTFDEGEAQPGSFEDVPNAGIRDVLPIHEISKVFYADTGKILNIGQEDEGNCPVLLLKRDVHAEPPRRMLHRSQMSDGGFHDESIIEGWDIDGENGIPDGADAQLRHETNSAATTPKADDHWRLPSGLDPEWMALEVYTEDDNNSSSGGSTPPSPTLNASSPSTNLATALSNLTFRSSTTSTPTHIPHSLPQPQAQQPIKSALSLLEMLIKLTALQQFRQESHLAIEDELLNFFLEDTASATAGGAAGKSARQKLRTDATKRVGFDPYDESPVKKRSGPYVHDTPNGTEDARMLSQRNGYSDLRASGFRSRSLTPSDAVIPTVEQFDDIPSSPPMLPHQPIQPRSHSAGLFNREQLKSSPTPPLPPNPFARPTPPHEGRALPSPQSFLPTGSRTGGSKDPAKKVARPKLKVGMVGDYADDVEQEEKYSLGRSK